MEIIEFGIENKKLTKKLYQFPKKLYKKTPWVPLLKLDQLGSKILNSKGLLRKGHPYHEHAKVKYFMAKDENKKIIGTIAGTINYAHNDYHKDKTGFFGFLEVINNYNVAKQLLDKVKEWLKSEGMDTMRGPASFSVNEQIGLLIDNYESIPYMYNTYHLPYYKDFIEKYGFKKTMDLYAYLMPVKMSDSQKEQKRQDRMVKLIDKIKTRYNVTIEDFNKKKPEKHLKEIDHIFYEAWKNNWGVVPLSKNEFKKLADGILIAADPKMIKIAYINGEAAAFIGSLPDINEVISKNKKKPQIIILLKILWKLKRKKFKRIRLTLFGIKEEYRKMGLDSILFYEEFITAQKNGYQQCEISWLLETNKAVIQAAEKQNAQYHKTWRLYDYSI